MKFNIIICSIVLMLNCHWLNAQNGTTYDKKECEKYCLRQDSLNRIKLSYFKNKILEPAKKDKLAPIQNLKFLDELYQYLSLEFIERESIPTLNKPIFPVFQLEENQLGIFAFPKYSCNKNSSGYTECNDISAEHKAIINNPPDKPEPEYDLNPKLKPNPKAFTELVTDKNIRVYTANSYYQDEILELSSYTDECLEYYHYRLAKQKSQKVLFGTPFELQLEYTENTRIDQGIEKQYAKGCYDCSFEYEHVNTFATLKGIKNIYFTYTDTFPLNNKLNFPERAIRMQLMDGTVVILWSESIDLFGCSCL